VEAPAGAPEFTADAVTLGMEVCQCTSLPDGAADESGYAGMIQDAPPAASVLQGMRMSMIITDAGQAVTDADGGITGMSSPCRAWWFYAVIQPVAGQSSGNGIPGGDDQNGRHLSVTGTRSGNGAGFLVTIRHGKSG